MSIPKRIISKLDEHDKEEILSCEAEYSDRISFLEEEIRRLRHELFGRKSEKMKPENGDQLNLFNEAENEAEKPQEETVKIAEHTRKKGGRKPLPEDLPRKDIVHDIPEEEKICDCGCEMNRIGEEISEKLDIIPAQMIVERHIRPKYACPVCEGVETEGGTVHIAKMPPMLIPKSIVTAGLAAHICVSKFADYLPLYRQEKMFTRLGIDISRQTMSFWMLTIGEQIQPLINLMREEILSGPIINVDETTVQVMDEPGRANTSKSFMWVFIGGDTSRIRLYEYHPTRSGSVAKEFMDGYQGYVQTDGYVGYDFLDTQEGVLHVGCWAHARRKFKEVIDAKKTMKKPTQPGSAEKTIGMIAQLYEIEKRAQHLLLSPDEIRDLRLTEAKPILDEIKIGLDKRITQTPPAGLLGKAMAYALRQWPRLVAYIEDGRLSPDNNLVENAIRPFVVGRKNWLFCGSPNGANASANIYSLIETAKVNDLEPYAYLRFVFSKIPHATTVDDYAALLPVNVTPAMIYDFQNIK